MSALEYLLRASLEYVHAERPRPVVRLESVCWIEGPACRYCDGEHRCSRCAVEREYAWLVRAGMRCEGVQGRPCEDGGVRLREGAYDVLGTLCCRACALAACCGDGDDVEAIESALSAMEAP